MKLRSLDWLSAFDKYFGRVVHCHGCFDCLCIGHIRHLQAARQLGDMLIVTVTPDRYVNKPGRPIFSEDIRAECLAALECVDYVAVNEWPDAVETIRLLRPDVYVKGAEYRGKMTAALRAEEAAIHAVGGRLVFVDTPQFHTTELIERLSHA